MKTLRRLAYLALAVALTHIVFGAIVRISGSGMGCGDHWPKCAGQWFPPLDRPDLIIELTHRYLASVLIIAVASLAAVAWSKRRVAGVGGRGGVLRAAASALALVIATALFGAITVKLGNAPLATVGHWTLAATLLATLAATVIRAGGLGGGLAPITQATRKAARGALIAAGLALLTVIMGGMTAKIPGASATCQSFPLCGGSGAPSAGQHVQLTHRVLAFALALHVLGLVMAFRKRREPTIIRRAATIVLVLIGLQITLAAGMVMMHLPPVMRSAHQALGAGIWLGCFTMAYLARRSSRQEPGGAAASSAGVPAGGPAPAMAGGMSLPRGAES